MPKFKFNRLQWFVHFGSIIPFLVLVWDAISNNLTVNPIQEITQRTGRTAIIWLVLSLACTPLNVIFGLRPFNQVRRPLGLYSAFYASLHFITFLILDYGFNLNLIWQTIIEKPYILLGLSGFLVLILLTFTSTKKSMQKLGKKWNKLHRLVYLASIILLLHFFMALKFINALAIAVAIILVILLSVRIPFIRKFFVTRQPAWSGSVNNFLTGRKKKTISIKNSLSNE
ncbi:MAG: sulfoxide reductase heme-binding subunit YedZ [Anaerolineaceae bacterium]|nr:sulfoxide reductase heme-binding subunit YedZ [Anaerolineaceae bacterium]